MLVELFACLGSTNAPQTLFLNPAPSPWPSAGTAPPPAASTQHLSQTSPSPSRPEPPAALRSPAGPATREGRGGGAGRAGTRPPRGGGRLRPSPQRPCAAAAARHGAARPGTAGGGRARVRGAAARSSRGGRRRREGAAMLPAERPPGAAPGRGESARPRGARGAGPAARPAAGAGRLGAGAAAASPARAPWGAGSGRARPRPGGYRPGGRRGPRRGPAGGARRPAGRPWRTSLLPGRGPFAPPPPISDPAPAPAPSPLGATGLVPAAAQDAAVGPLPHPFPSLLNGRSARLFLLPAPRRSRSAAPQLSRVVAYALASLLLRSPDVNCG